MAILTVAGCCDCEYIAAQHEPMAATAGLSDTERAAIARKDFVGSDLTPLDRTVAEFVTAVIGAPRVSDRLFDQARGALTDREIIEVLQICGYYWCLARVATILDLKPTTIYGQMPHLGDT
ncbi:hypothetical protein BHQ21_03245 [Mycobacterium sherrisii]|uniref:Carboxymuconolactone decarboxylase-like domain-containing protein n=1 Tax=Mycobacterium sherrisii TaxID=243061 RepID=A0A1E3T8U9_9MYCO|nr:hypothetical protein BHQ21_03245 [Mycobacterium sherrisii]